MLFNSIQFVIFLPLVVILYFMIPHRFRVYFLLAASYYFYMCWKAEYIFLIMGSTLIDYYAGIQIEKSKTQKRKKRFLILSVITNLGILFSFKYFNFINDSVRTVFDHLNIFYGVPAFRVFLPVGISFYTFQSLSYSIDLYRGVKEKAERNIVLFALYVAFFPQLVAGPIERSTRLIPQFYEKKTLNYENLVEGLKLILWGMFKKLVIADRLAIYVNTVFNNQSEHNGTSLIMATLFFTFQVYCDFSAYSDIAIGSARMMGYDLMINFRRPFFSRSFSEFWKRWHISLITWFRDYLYIPLGGNRVPKWRWYLNIMLVWTISGLWHGAGWNFVLWGSISGLFLLLAVWLKPLRVKFWELTKWSQETRLHRATQILFTFFLFYFVQFFFRANSTGDSLQIIHKVFTDWGPLFIGEMSHFAYGLFGIIFLIIVEYCQEYYTDSIKFMNSNKIVIRYLTYASIIVLILMIGVFDGSQFIYFQF
jgi:alginate O-acetyltransferase complex protein AlgI